MDDRQEPAPAWDGIVPARLDVGRHASPHDGVCVLEAASLLEGGEFNEHPSSTSPVASDFLRGWNDLLETEPRQALRRFVPRLPGSRGDAATEARRLQSVADWMVRTHAPAWLALAGWSHAAERLRTAAWPAGAEEARASAGEALQEMTPVLAGLEPTFQTFAHARADRLTGTSGGAAAAATCRTAVLREHGGFADVEPWFYAVWAAWCAGWTATSLAAADATGGAADHVAERLRHSALILVDELLA